MWPINTFTFSELALVENGCSPLSEVIITYRSPVVALEGLGARQEQQKSSWNQCEEDEAGEQGKDLPGNGEDYTVGDAKGLARLLAQSTFSVTTNDLC